MTPSETCPDGQIVTYQQAESSTVKVEALAGGKFKCSVSIEHSARPSSEVAQEAFLTFLATMKCAYEAGYNQEDPASGVS